MEDFSPARIQPTSSGAEKKTEDDLPLILRKARLAARKALPPPLEFDDEIANADEHQLDEQA
jgi:hypothetical protein